MANSVDLDHLIVLGFNDTSTIVVHFVWSPRERDRVEERDGQGRNKNRNEGEETEEIKTFPPLPFPATRIDSRPCPTVIQYQLDAPVTDLRHLISGLHCLLRPVCPSAQGHENPNQLAHH